jgi:hypothetical protein
MSLRCRSAAELRALKAAARPRLEHRRGGLPQRQLERRGEALALERVGQVS